MLVCASRANAAPVDVPVDVGVGPAAFLFVPSPVWDDQHIHYGLKLSLQAIINQQLLQKEKGRIPPQYRDMVLKQKEIRLTPFPLTLIPEDIFISPKLEHTGIYGATFKPISIGAAMGGGGIRLGLDLGVVLTAAYLYSDTLPNTFFLRPGLGAQAELELMPSDVFGISIGWESCVYVPQVLGTFWSVTPTDNAIWHIGDAFVKLHFRFPYEANL
ncbi:MAG: hypothetical protein JST54_26725 [Deltaproteobacteria bacterium]|nr:hypothetical protein [Deltaproteobacteria bacterium]